MPNLVEPVPVVPSGHPIHPLREYGQRLADEHPQDGPGGKDDDQQGYSQYQKGDIAQPFQIPAIRVEGQGKPDQTDLFVGMNNRHLFDYLMRRGRSIEREKRRPLGIPDKKIGNEVIADKPLTDLPDLGIIVIPDRNREGS